MRVHAKDKNNPKPTDEGHLVQLRSSSTQHCLIAKQVLSQEQWVVSRANKRGRLMIVKNTAPSKRVAFGSRVQKGSKGIFVRPRQ